MDNENLKQIADQAGLSDQLYDHVPGAARYEEVWGAIVIFAGLLRSETIRECAAVCDKEQMAWELRSLESPAPYDWKASGAGACAKRLRGMLARDE